MYTAQTHEKPWKRQKINHDQCSSMPSFLKLPEKTQGEEGVLYIIIN